MDSHNGREFGVGGVFLMTCIFLAVKVEQLEAKEEPGTTCASIF
jgi:hypothetical protein